MPGAAPQPAAIEVETFVEAGDWPEHGVLAERSDVAVAAALARARPALAAGAEMTVILTDDDHIRSLNRRFRKKDRPTNVLSFPAGPPVGGRLGPLLGDVVLARETVSDEAEERGVSIADHAIHLVVHGFLHLIGYDHETAEEAVVMEGLETFIMQDLGLPDPYAT